MASPPLVLPGVLFVGEDERARIFAHTGPAAGWHVPRGILGWSTEVSFVERKALTDEIRRSTKLVMPAEQIPPARMPLTSQAAQNSPLVAVASRLVSKLVESGVRVHTVGVDRVTSSFYYLAEGGGEDQIRVEGDLVQSVGAMLGERADNAAIERVLDGLPDRLLRALSKNRLSELTVELAAALPRAATDGSGTAEVDLDAFEKDLSQLLANAETYANVAGEIASKLAETNERRVELPRFGEARKVSQGPFDIMVGEGRVSIPTYERWVMSGTIAEGAAAKPSAAPASTAAAPKRPDSQDSMLASLETSSTPTAAEAEAQAAAAAKAAEEAKAAQAAAAAKAAKAAEEAKAAQAAAAAKAAEEKRKADEAAKAAAAKAAEEAKAAQAAAAAKAAEEKRKADEAAKAAAAKAAEQAANAAAAKAAEEEAKKAAQAAKAAEEAQAAAAAKAAEEAQAAAVAEGDDEHDAPQPVAAQGTEARKVEPKKKGGKKAAQARKAEEARKAAEAKKAENKKADDAAKAAAAAKKAEAPKSEAPKAAAKASSREKTGTAITPQPRSNTMLYVVLLVLAAVGAAAWAFLNR